MPEIDELASTVKGIGVAALDAAEKALAVGFELGEKAAAPLPVVADLVKTQSGYVTRLAHTYTEVARSLLA